VRADLALDACLRLGARKAIDIGSGDGLHAARLRSAGVEVVTVSLREPADVIADYLDTNIGPVDLVWASHVLEHQPNPNLFLKKCFADLRDGGWLCVTVPPLKHEIVGGHVSLWNAGLLLYHLILAGFDCRDAMVKCYGYNISALVQKIPARLPALAMDFGDIEALSEFFPFPVANGFRGDFESANW
jgi:SAM-dependent methyltransferase